MATATSKRPAAKPEPHAACYLFPEADAETRLALKRDIAEAGVKVPIVVWTDPDGRRWIIDGRHRFEIAAELGIPCPTTEFAGSPSDMLSHVLRLNFTRRHLLSSQRAAVAAKATLMADMYRNPDGAAGNPNFRKRGGVRGDAKGGAADELAHASGSNRTYIRDAKRLNEQAPELPDEVAAGRKTIPAALREMNGVADADEDIARDAFGNHLPESLREAWEQSQAIEQTVREFGAPRANLRKLPEGPLSDQLKDVVPSVSTRIRDALAALRAVELHAMCLACSGAGCKACGHSGFFTAAEFNALPDAVQRRYRRCG